MGLALASSVEQLLARRADLLREVGEIDTELERARLALQGLHPPKTAKPGPKNYRRDIRVAGSVPNDIYGALAIREPRTIRDLAAHLKVSTVVIQNNCSAMVQAGRLSRVRAHNMGRTYLYARTSEALTVTPPLSQPSEMSAEGEAADAAG